jgi:hypothetical protein
MWLVAPCGASQVPCIGVACDTMSDVLERRDHGALSALWRDHPPGPVRRVLPRCLDQRHEALAEGLLQGFLTHYWVARRAPARCHSKGESR